MKILNLFFALALPFFAVAQTPKNDGWLIPFAAKNGKIGYVNEVGKMVIEPQFEHTADPFRPGELSVNAKKNGQTVRVFRSGHTLENPHLELGRTMPVVNFDLADRPLDTLPTLVATIKSRDIVLLDLGSGKTLQTYSARFLNLPRWAKLASEYAEGALSEFRFRGGAARLFREDGRVNFFDKNLKPIFSTDFAAGCVADERFFVVAEAENRFGIGGRAGKIVVPMVWKRLEPSGAAGLFFANRPENEYQLTGSAGLIDASGKIVIDTVHAFIKPIPGGRFFLVKKNEREGVFDLKGREILPIEAKQISIFHLETIAYEGPDRKWNLLDRRGRRVLEAGADQIDIRPFGEMPHFLVKNGETTAVLDTNFQTIFREEGAAASIVRQSPLLFFVQKKGKNRLVARDGKPVFEGDFDQIENYSSSDRHYLFLKKDTVRAILATDGKFILPFEFSKISVEIRSKDTLFWGKPLGSKLYFAHDRTGKRTSAGFPSPNSRAIGAIAEGHELPNGRGRAVVLFNGERVVLPDSLRDCRVMADARLGAEHAIIAFGKQGEKSPRAVVNEKFESILPVGFNVPERVVDENALERISETGFVAVRKLDEHAPRPMPKPMPKPAPRPKTEEAPVEISIDVKADEPPSPVEEMPTARSGFGTGVEPKFSKKITSGVVDFEGKWLVGPTEGVEFLPYSPFLVAEFPAGTYSANHSFVEKGIRMHVVAGPEKGKIIEANWLGRDGFDHETKIMKVGRTRKGTTRMAEYAYFDEKGKAVTDWIFENGPDFLGPKNLVHIWEKDVLRARQAVIDEQGKILFELGEWMTEDPPRDRGGDDKWAYLTIKARKLGENLPESLMDTTGRVLFEPRFFDLGVGRDDRFLTAKNEAGKGLIASLDGQVLHVFENVAGSILSQKLGEKTGYVAVWNDRETVILSPKNRVVQRFSMPVDRRSVDQGLREKFVALLDGQRRVFADFRTGQVFME